MIMRALDSCYERFEKIKYLIRKETDPYNLEKLKRQVAVEKVKIEAVKKQLAIESKVKELKKMDQSREVTVASVVKMLEGFMVK